MEADEERRNKDWKEEVSRVDDEQAGEVSGILAKEI